MIHMYTAAVYLCLCLLRRKGEHSRRHHTVGPEQQVLYIHRAFGTASLFRYWSRPVSIPLTASCSPNSFSVLLTSVEKSRARPSAHARFVPNAKNGNQYFCIRKVRKNNQLWRLNSVTTKSVFDRVESNLLVSCQPHQYRTLSALLCYHSIPLKYCQCSVSVSVFLYVQ